MQEIFIFALDPYDDAAMRITGNLELFVTKLTTIMSSFLKVFL